MSSTYFSPVRQTTVREVQNTIRQIDMSLFPSVREKLGQQQTFVYSLLAGCCSFIGSPNLNAFSQEILDFAYNVVTPIVNACFEEIKKKELTNPELKIALFKNLEKIQYYPQVFDFETIQNEEMIAELKKIITVGTYTLYKLNPESEKFYGGRIDISDEVFSKVVKILENYGYKEDEDIVGSSFDQKGHITTIEPRELAENYDQVVSSHENREAALEPTSLRIGNPQSGRLSRAVTIGVNVNELDVYRNKLGAMKIPPHLSVFTQEIKAFPELKDISIFTNSEDNPFLKKLHRFLSEVL